MASEVKTNKISPSTSTTVTLGDASDVFQLPASAEIDIASGATLDVNGNIDFTGATVTGLTTGKVLQVVQSVKTDTASTTVNAGTFADIAGTDQAGAGSIWCVKITPSATSSTILVSWANSIGSTQANQTTIFKLFRNAVNPFLGDAAGDRVVASMVGSCSSGVNNINSSSGQYLDSPSLTSEVTYKLQWSQEDAQTIYLNRAGTDTDDATHMRSASTITVVEIGV